MRVKQQGRTGVEMCSLLFAFVVFCYDATGNFLFYWESFSLGMGLVVGVGVYLQVAEQGLGENLTFTLVFSS